MPDGKRLIIEFVTFNVDVSTGEKVFAVLIPTLGNGSLGHRISLPTVVNTAFGDTFMASQPARLYADPGSEVRFAIQRVSAGTGGHVVVTISRYLVNVP